MQRKVAALLLPLFLPSTFASEAVRANALIVDIDCDGKPDKVTLTRTPSSATVHVALGSAIHKATKLTFTVSPGQQAAICGYPVWLEIDSLDYAPTEDTGSLPGFQPSKSCKAFALVDDRCDSIHFYWNHDAGRLGWWRY